MPTLPPVIVPRFRFRRGALEPPGLWLTDDDFVVIRFRGSAFRLDSGANAPPIQLEARLRILAPDLRPADVRVPFSVPFTETPATVELRSPLVPGFLQGAWCGVPVPNARGLQDLLQVGMIFVQLAIGKGQSSEQYIHTLLDEGYVSESSALGWPASNAPAERAGRGAVVFQLLPNFGGGVEMQVGPVQGHWRLMGLKTIFHTSATVAARHVTFTVIQSATPAAIIYQAAAPVTQAASLAVAYTLGAGVGKSNVLAALQECQWPADLWMRPNDFILTGTSNLQAGDLYDNSRALLEVWD